MSNKLYSDEWYEGEWKNGERTFCNRLLLLEAGSFKIDQNADSIDVKTIMSGLQ